MKLNNTRLQLYDKTTLPNIWKTTWCPCADQCCCDLAVYELGPLQLCDGFKSELNIHIESYFVDRRIHVSKSDAHMMIVSEIKI